MKKRIICIFLAVITVFLLSSCKGKNIKDTSSDTKEKSSETASDKDTKSSKKVLIGEGGEVGPTGGKLESGPASDLPAPPSAPPTPPTPYAQ